MLTLSRAKLEELVSELVDKAIAVTKEAMKEADISVSEINEVILVGGQTRMPKIIEEVGKRLAKEPHKGINPDEVVAAGAAIQGGIMGGDVKDVLLLDVTPLTLGIETLGGVRTPLIEKNTTVPVEKSQVFSTAADNQPQVEIHVLQGEREMAQDNKSLGRFILSGIPPAPRGTPQIEVKFDIDANGILNVSAKDNASGKEQSIRIEGSSGLSKEEVERMKQEAEKFAEEDKKKKEGIEVKNQAEQLVYLSEKTLKDAGDKVEEATKKSVEEKIEELKKVKDGEDLEAIKKASDELSAEIQKVGAAMYEKEQAEQNDAPKEEGKEDKKEDVVEGSAEEKTE